MEEKMLAVINKAKELLKRDNRLDWNKEYSINPKFIVRNDKMILESITFDWDEHSFFHERLYIYSDKIVFSSTFGLQDVLFEYKGWTELLSL